MSCLSSSLLEPTLSVLRPELSSPDGKRRLVAAKCLGLLRGYAARWVEQPYRIDAVESTLTSDLYNPETRAKSRSFLLAGKLDVQATEIATGDRLLFDHKTTSDAIDDPNAPFWRILVVDSQLSHYMLLEWLHGNKLDFGLWDVVKKPGISPKLLSKADLATVLASGTYLDHTLTEEDRAALALEPRETPDMFAARLAEDCTTVRPLAYFQRRKVPRLDMETLEYAGELWGHGQDILAARREGRWPRNPAACFTYSTPCQYLGICSGHDSLDSGNWERGGWRHPELVQIGDGDGVDVLTNSRVKTFQTCRRKHHLRYELGLKRVEEEESEALFLGSLFHRALEQYYLALQQHQQKGTYR